ncbi:MAG: outer membrane protein assembly factor BamA [Bryobacteraceae bacterium]
MMFHRPGRLHALGVCLLCTLGASVSLDLRAQPAVPRQPAISQQPAAQSSPPEQQKKVNPFEEVPTEKAPVPQVPAPAPGQTTPNIIEDIVFRGARRVPQSTLKALIYSKKGDPYSEDTLHRDFMALWNTGRFDDIRLEREPGKTGWIITFVVVERRVVRSIKYDGIKSVTVSEILDRFKERKVGLSVEQQYDPNKVQRAKVVLQEFLGERGRQFATVTPDVHQIPPSSLEIVFKVNEGPKVKVGTIQVFGNKVFDDREVIRAMHNSHPIGIPHSIFFENLFARTYDSSKLDEDMDRVRDFYQKHGYFTAHVTDHTVKIVDVPGGKFHIPLFFPNKPGKHADLTVTVEEGRLYHLNKINFVGVKLFRTPETLMGPLFGMKEGDVFSTEKLRKGIENLRKLYGEFGYIDFVPEPSFDPIPGSDQLDLTLNVDEGHQFFVRRIDFSGNTTTRDRVIRRELLVDEGDMFNQRLWNLSLLRLNQLGYFEVLKEGEAADITRDTKTNTVDITLKVKERGKNSIQLNGGVSGIAGSFVGASYSTNNFLGLGETLSLSSQVGTRMRSVQFSFTEPYLFDLPIQAGFTVFLQRFNYDQAREASILSGENLIPLYQQLGSNNLLNYISNSHGFTVFASYPLKRSFARFGLSYGYNIQSIQTLTTASSQYFDYIDFQGVGGPNSLTGIKTSQIIPSYTYNTVNHPITPTAGKEIYLSTAFSGGFLGGNVDTIQPTFDFKTFRRGFKKNHVFGYHVSGRFLTGFSGKVAPPFNRFYMGGEDDIRGFDIWGISPIAYLPSEATINVLNNDGSPRMQKVVNADGSTGTQGVTQNIPIYQLEFPGGDTSVVANVEYRIPIVGPVTLAPFFDAGIDKLVLPGQLRLNPGRIQQLNADFPQASFSGRALIAPDTQKPRASTGLEIQVLMPVVNAPFRFYWAYNPSVVREYLQVPIVSDRALFANQATFNSAVSQFGQAYPFFEQRSTFRFSIGRTF